MKAYDAVLSQEIRNANVCNVAGISQAIVIVYRSAGDVADAAGRAVAHARAVMAGWRNQSDSRPGSSVRGGVKWIVDLNGAKAVDLTNERYEVLVEGSVRAKGPLAVIKRS